MCPTPQNSSSQEIPPGEARILVVVVVVVVGGGGPGAKRWKRCAGAQGAHHLDLEGCPVQKDGNGALASRARTILIWKGRAAVPSDWMCLSHG